MITKEYIEVVAKNIKEQQEATNEIMNHKFQPTGHIAMTIRTLTNTLLFLIVSVIIFPGLCMLASVFLSIIGVLNADEGVKLFTFGFDLYGIR